MRPTLRQLQYIIAIAETGRFGEAAKRLNVSQPSLSAQVAEVEAALDVVLIERNRNGALMTPLGAEFVRRAREVLKDMQDLKDAMALGREGLNGRLRLGVLPSIGPYLLPSAVKTLHARHPDFRLSVQEANTFELEQMLKEGNLDTIISTPEDHPATRHEILFEERLWVCAAPDDPISGTGPLAPEQLKGRSLLTVGFGHRLSLIVQALADEFGAHVSTEFQGTSLDATRQMAAMGAGLAVLPSLYALSEARRDPDLVIRPIEAARARRTLSMAWREGSPLGERFKMIAELLRENARPILESA